jgi:hypothetical protein
MHPTTGPRVSIRGSKPARLVQAAMAAVGAVVFTGQVALTVAQAEWTAALVIAAFGSLWLTMGIRFIRTAVFTTADGQLVVRNVGRTWTLPRSSIAEVRLPTGPAAVAGGNALSLLLTDGKVVRLEATSRWPVGGHRRAAAARARDLRGWLAHPG